MASTYLSRTPASAGNRKTWTLSGWYKFADNSTVNTFLSAGSADADRTILIRNGSANGDLRFLLNDGGNYVISQNYLRDLSAWYHIVFSIDTTQATASNRVKIYINGIQVTSFSTEIYPTQNTDLNINNNTLHTIGKYSYDSAGYFDGSMAHVHFIDGTAYDASAFGETDATTGIWKPKTAPSVTYGTNGFFLKFENSGSMGTDSSGNGNNFTVNGTMTQTIDTPSNVFATLNPLFAGTSNSTFSNGNLTYTSTGAAQKNTISTLGVSQGKWYCESKLSVISSNYPGIGIMDSQSSLQTTIFYLGSTADSYCIFPNGDIYNNGSLTSIGTTFVNTDIIGLGLDLDSGTKTLKIYKNGSLVHTETINSPSNAYVFATSNNLNTTQTQFNFGNGYFGTTAVSSAQNPDDGIGIFEYSVPTGYKALCTKSINAQEYA